MSDEVKDAPLHEQLDQSSMEYIEARMIILELFFQDSHEVLEVFEAEHDRAVEAHLMASAWAALEAEGRNAGARAARVDVATVETRKAVKVAHAALRVAKGKFKGRSEERALLQTRAATLREQFRVLGGGGKA